MSALRVVRYRSSVGREIVRPSAWPRETIDRDQFERLLAGEDEGTVFPDEAPAEPELPEPQPEPKRERPRPRPFPLPGSAMQGPDPAKS